MADKKVERSGRERPFTPTQKMEAALSDPGTLNMAEPRHDKAKSTLVDKFREREERWRRDQALHDREAAHAAERGGREPGEVDEPADSQDQGEGGE